MEKITFQPTHAPKDFANIKNRAVIYLLYFQLSPLGSPTPIQFRDSVRASHHPHLLETKLGRGVNYHLGLLIPYVTAINFPAGRTEYARDSKLQDMKF